MVRHGGVTYEVLTDHLGSYRGLVDVATGTVSGEVAYDEYGRVTAGEIPAWIPFGWAGGLWDPLTGLVRLGARDYDPETGRWFQKDPVGLDGGLNVYEYAESDPVNLVDAYGRSADAPNPFALRAKGALMMANDATAEAGEALYVKASCQIGKLAEATVTAAGVGMLAFALPSGVRHVGAGARSGLSKIGTRGCFAAGTPIQTEHGLEPIEDIQPGELVWSLDEETGEAGLSEVVRTFVRPGQPVLEVELADGDGVEVR